MLRLSELGSYSRQGIMRIGRLLGLFVLTIGLSLGSASAQQLVYPQVVRMKYEAADPAGGVFIIWLDRERIEHGLGPRIPRVQTVEVTHLTPSPGSPILTTIEVLGVNSTVPDVYQVAGVVRVKMIGMVLKSTNTER